ncbi:hypothetical protein ABG768_007411 [Culter alburnus]|uniref:Uncharacterized protein n=1 Tax=Culter alburnus TaxID=194366 RepID=A0AAW1ZKL2_CULAL
MPWPPAQPPVTSLFVLSKPSFRAPPAAHPFFRPIDAVLGQHVQSEAERGTFLLQKQVAFRAEFRKSSPCDYACSTDSSVFTLALICHPRKLTQARRSRQHPAKVAPRGP